MPAQAPIALVEEAEQVLGDALLQYPEVVAQVADKGTPHLLCAYLYDLAGAFSRFYERCPVLTADSAAARDSRLKLARLTAATLKQGLGLLGIDTLERL